MIAVKLAPLKALYEEVELDAASMLELAKPLVEAVQDKIEKQIKDGEFELVVDPTPEQRQDYTKPLQDYRLRKLKTALSNIRNNLLKKDFQERSKEIQALEEGSHDHAVWMEAYKKLKIKLTGQKIVDTPVKQVKYYNFESS